MRFVSMEDRERKLLGGCGSVGKWGVGVSADSGRGGGSAGCEAGRTNGEEWSDG